VHERATSMLNAAWLTSAQIVLPGLLNSACARCAALQLGKKGVGTGTSQGQSWLARGLMASVTLKSQTGATKGGALISGDGGGLGAQKSACAHGWVGEGLVGRSLYVRVDFYGGG
jgi:hypothetical protein